MFTRQLQDKIVHVVTLQKAGWLKTLKRFTGREGFLFSVRTGQPAVFSVISLKQLSGLMLQESNVSIVTGMHGWLQKHLIIYWPGFQMTVPIAIR
jgi:hypothetical protein